MKTTLGVLPSLPGVKLALVIDTLGNEFGAYKPDNTYQSLAPTITALIKSETLASNLKNY